MEQIPILQCAAKYPEVGIPGLNDTIFDSLQWQTSIQSAAKPRYKHAPLNDFSPTPNATKQAVKEAFIRKQNPIPATRQKNKMDLNCNFLSYK